MNVSIPLCALTGLMNLMSLPAAAQIPNPAAPAPTSWWLAVSFSMPQTSLEQAAREAARLKLPLIFRGLPVARLKDERVTDPKADLAQQFGLHWIARTQRYFEPLQKAGAVVQIDPIRFESARVTDVPRLVYLCPQDPNTVFSLRGDVRAGWASEYLQKQLTQALKALPESENGSMRQCLKGALDTLPTSH